MSHTLTIKAPAKINLTLDVTGKRPDGYHELCMIMQTIDLCDIVTIEWIDKEEICFSMNQELPDKIPAEKNLVWKAASLMKETYQIRGGFRIYLEKNIPAAAGLAGGSTDCAATLTGINQICKLGLDLETLCRLGVTLGADVPFCIQKGTMLSEGIGEILTPLPKLSPLWTLLIKPNLSVSTGYVYTHLNLDELSSHPDTSYMIDCITRKDHISLGKGLSNVLETVTIAKYPELAQIKQFFTEQGALGSLMSGSGSTIYGLYADETTAEIAYDNARKQYPGYHVILCQTKVPESCL